MKKLVFVIEQLTGGGAERVTAALVNQIIRETEYEIHIVVYAREMDTDYSVDGRVKWHVLPGISCGRGKAILKRLFFLRESVREIRPDCVLSLGTPRIAVLLAVSMIGSGVPLILSERNDPSRFPVTKTWRILRTASYYLADKVVFQTSQARDYFPVMIRKKGIVICNPITGNLPERYEGVREKRIVNFCRLSPQKNLDLLIEAFAEISSLFPEHTLCVYGEGSERVRLEDKIRRLGLEKKVQLPGHSNNIYEDIRKAALFVSSSDYEGISNSMLEAIALGIPTICTDCPAGGARETICDGINGLLMPVGDKNKLAEAMKRVLSDEAFSQKISQEGSLLRKKIDAASVAQQWMDVIAEVSG